MLNYKGILVYPHIIHKRVDICVCVCSSIGALL